MSANPRIHIGANGGPPLEEESAYPFTREEALMVEEAAFLWARKASTSPEALLGVRGKRRDLNIRRALNLSLRDVVPASTIAQIIGCNRCTVEDDQSQANGWAERNETCAESFEHMAMAVRSYVTVRWSALEEAITLEASNDALLRKLDQERRSAERAARQAEEAAAAIVKRTQERKRKQQVDALETQLRDRGVANYQAMVAQHRGATHTAERLSTPALKGLAMLMAADAKTKFMDRRLIHDRVPGITELKRLGMAKDLAPWGPNDLADDAGIPRVGITEFGMRVMKTAATLTQTPHLRKRA